MNYQTPVRARTTGSHIRQNNNALSASRSGQFSPATDRRTPGKQETAENAQIVQKFTEFLNQDGGSFDLDWSQLTSKRGPSTKVFEQLLLLAISQIDLLWPMNMTPAEIQSEVPQFLKFIECPVLLKKSDIVAPHGNWPKCLSALAHLCQIVMDEDFDLIEMPPLEEQLFRFSDEYYRLYVDPNFQYAEEQMARELEKVLEGQLNIVQSKHSREKKQEELLSKKLEAHENKTMDVKHLQQTIQEIEITGLQSAKEHISELEENYELLKQEKKNADRNICGMKAELKNLENRESELRQIVNTQDVSQEDAKEMKNEIESMERSGQEILDSLDGQEVPAKREKEQKLSRKNKEIQRLIDTCNSEIKEIRSKLPPSVERKLDDIHFIENNTQVSPPINSLNKTLEDFEEELETHFTKQASKNKELQQRLHILQKSENNKMYQIEQKKCMEIQNLGTIANREHNERMTISDQEEKNLTELLEALKQKLKYTPETGNEPDIKEEYETACAYYRKVIEICEAKEASVNECMRRLESAISSLEQETRFLEQQEESKYMEEQENIKEKIIG